uniref:non-specific serine/threonine protein kinase n=3 Tax=Aegilops tauschii subsp. strangulata TaxID=200361 RepID=A0A453DUD5_AEGTS
ADHHNPLWYCSLQSFQTPSTPMPPSSWFLTLIWVWCLPLMLVEAEEQQEEVCSAKCGAVTISNPFWFTDLETGRSCGSPGSPDFQLTCLNNSYPLLPSSVRVTLGFAILNISYGERSLHVIDLGKLQLLHDPPKPKIFNSCLPVWNTSTKLGRPFKISPINLELILYNCTEKAAARARREKELVRAKTMRCVNTSNTFVRAGVPYDPTGSYSGYALEDCAPIVLPVLPSGETNASHYERLIQSGFLLKWEPPPPGGSKKTTRIFIILGSLGGLAALAAFVTYLLHQRKRKRAVASDELMRSGSSMTSYSKDLELGGSPHIFTFEELEVATDGFSASRELGDGGFGTVYKGKLKDGRVVAVKRLYKNNYRRVEQFLNEVDILSRLLHQNLVILYGCTSRMSRDLLLVYEFIANGTVADHLHGSRSAERGLTWPLRLNIAIETAEALAYLHAVEIIHRDVKTTNILLDNSFHVKVADFGLSRLFPLEVTHVSTVPQGTPGYVDPVYHQCYKLTDKSDVYSFGVVLVELISSKPAVDMSRSHSEINLANMALNRIQNHEVVQLVDLELGYDTDPETKRTIDRVAEVAFQCLQMERDLRPSIKEVVEILTCVRDGDCRAKSMKKKASQKEDAHLLTEGLQFSPDSVIHRFHSQSTNHSVASNASGL